MFIIITPQPLPLMITDDNIYVMPDGYLRHTMSGGTEVFEMPPLLRHYYDIIDFVLRLPHITPAACVRVGNTFSRCARQRAQQGSTATRYAAALHYDTAMLLLAQPDSHYTATALAAITPPHHCHYAAMVY